MTGFLLLRIRVMNHSYDCLAIVPRKNKQCVCPSPGDWVSPLKLGHGEDRITFLPFLGIP